MLERGQRRPRLPVDLPAPRKVVVVHEEPRSVVVGHVDTPAGPVVVANTHLSYVPGWQRVQLARIRRDLRTVTSPVLLMGDLNMRGDLPQRITGYRSLAAHPTFPLDAPDRQLDHILLRGRLGTVTHSSAVELPLSDHRALVVELSV